jgi:hypothetical protein
MLKKILLGAAVWAAAGAGWLGAAAPLNAAVRTRNDSVERLEWEARDSWGAAAPTVKGRRVSVHVLHNKTLVLRTDANAALGEGSHFSNVFVGQSPTKLDGFGTLLIEGGSLSIDGVMEVMRQGNYPGSRGELVVSGAGRLALTGNGVTYGRCEEPSGTLSVGSNRAGLKGGEGGVTLRDGATVLLARLCVGSATETQGRGRVMLSGSGARVAGGAGGVRLNATGTLVFEADAKGFGTMSVAGSVSADAAARVEVDGRAYRGDGGEFALVRARDFSCDGKPGLGRTEVSGFGNGYAAALGLSEDGRTLLLRVRKTEK